MNTLAVSAATADKLSLMMAALAFAFAALALLRRWPKLGVLAWFGVVAFVPSWMGVNISGYFPPTTLTALLVLASLVPLTVGRLGLPDLLSAAFFAALLLPLGLGGMRLPALFTAVLIWGASFALGRLMPLRVDPEWIGGAFAIIMGLVAAGALLEFVLSSNPFGMLTASNASYGAWSPLQMRGGVLRAEGAFGHSIALGASLALAIPFAVGARFPMFWRSVLVLLLLAGITVTFSRGAMAAGVLALLLSVVALRNGLSMRVRVGILLVGAAAVAALLPFVSQVFADAGTEAANSSDYRGQLLGLVGAMTWIGTSNASVVTAGGDSLYAGFNSVDSAVLLVGLTYGIVALICAVVLFGAGLVALLRRRGGPAVIAVVAQVPVLLTVALITQYAALFWFVVGLAVHAVTTMSQSVIDEVESDIASDELQVGNTAVAPVRGSAVLMESTSGGDRQWAPSMH